MPFQIIRNDITKVRADAIVNTANPEPVYASGTDAAVYRAAGADRLLAERKKIGRIMPGEVAVTSAFRLRAKYLIHTVGPVWQDGRHGRICSAGILLPQIPPDRASAGLQQYCLSSDLDRCLWFSQRQGSRHCAEGNLGFPGRRRDGYHPGRL